MRHPLRLRLVVLVLVAGAASLGAELTGARLLAPFFGTSDIVWANVIGLTLIYLSVGYWIGGRLADRYPTERALATVAMVSALSVAAIPFATRPLFEAATDAFADISAGAFIASFVGALLMFSVPVTCLGAIAPWAIRLALTDVQESGSISGRLYAISTIGSIVGTFGSTLLLVPLIGSRRTLLVFAVLLAAAAVPLLTRWSVAVPVALAALIAVPVGSVKSAGDDEVLFEGESSYQFVQVVEQDDGDRILRLNEGWGVHSILPARGGLTDGYWDAFLTLPLLTGRDDGRIAVLGNAGGTVANLYEAAWPEMGIDGVEIDPVVSQAGREHLGMRNPRLEVHTADARFFLRGAEPGYDAIIGDAYRQPYVPFHLVTREFFQLAHDRLAPDGVVAINVGTPPELTELVDRIATTMRAVFPVVWVARYDDFNSVLLGFRDAATAAGARERLAAARGMPAVAGRRLLETLVDVPVGGTPLTDDHAPIEWLTDRALVEYLKDGAPGA